MRVPLPASLLAHLARRRRAVWLSAELAVAAVLIVAAAGTFSAAQAVSPLMILRPSPGAVVGLDQLRGGTDLPVIFLAPDSTEYATLSLRRTTGGPDVLTVPPFALQAGAAGGLVESAVPLSTGGQTVLRVSLFMPLPPGVDGDLRLVVGIAASGGSLSASESVDFRLDLAAPKIGPSHTTRTDESDQDVVLNRVCVEVDEPLARIELACNGTWLGAVAPGEPERMTLKGPHAIYCLHAQPVPAGCTGLMVRVTDEAGNVSAPYDLGDFVCSLPSKQVSEGGRRNALLVDADDRLHAAYILQDGVYYATQAPDGAWQREPIHCRCGFDPDTQRCSAKDCPKRYGLNVGLAVDDAGTPGVCFVYGDAFDPQLQSEYTAVGEVHVHWQEGAEPGEEWPGAVLGQGEARFFHCAIANAGRFGDMDYPGTAVIYDEGRPYDQSSVLVSQIQVSASSWSRDQVAGFLGREVSAVQSAAGQVHVVFRGSPPGGPEEAFRLNYAWHGRGATGAWQTAPVEDGQGRPIFGSRPSLALGPRDLLAMSYMDAYAMIPAFAARQIPAGTAAATEVWDSEGVLWNDPFFGQYALGAYARPLNPGRLASQDGVYVGADSSLVFGADGDAQVVFVAEKRQKPGTTDVADLGELIAASRAPNGRWAYSVLDGRVEESVDVSAATNGAGRLRVLFHNGLHPPGREGNGAFGSLQYWHAESRSVVYANPDDAIGAPLPSGFASCAALAHRQDETLARLTEPQVNLQPDPVRLVADPANPNTDDLADLFERVRRYTDFGALPLWDSADLTQESVRTSLMANPLLSYPLQELARFVDNLGTPGGFAARLDSPSPLVPADPVPSPPPSLQQDVVSGSLIEDVFAGLQIRSDPYSPVVKTQVNVCVPNNCSLQSALIRASEPVTSTPPSAAVVHALGTPWSGHLGQWAQFCQSADSLLVVGVNGKVQTGCYRCPFSGQRVIGLPGVDVPVCVQAWAKEDPDYRRVDGLPYLTCLVGGCDDTRAPSVKCPPGPAATPGQPASVEESWHSVPGRAQCVHCPAGTTHTTCSDETAAKCGKGGACATDLDGGQCAQADRACTDDAGCDVAAGFGCVGGVCHKLPECEKDADCSFVSVGVGSGTKPTCANGLCRAACTMEWQCASQLSCLSGGCAYTDPLRFDRGDLLCQSAGCSTCVGNTYCLDPASVSSGLDCLSDGRCVFCPAGHTCATQGAVTSPVCLLRPLANDYFVPLAALLPGQEGSVLSMPARLRGALGSLNVPTEMDGRSIEFGETVQRGGLRLRGNPIGPQHQGYIVLAVEFPRDIEVSTTCGASVSIPKPVLRIRYQPYSFDGRIYAASVDMGVYPSLDATAPIQVTADNLDCKAGCVHRCGLITDAHLALVNSQFAALLGGELNDTLTEVLDGSLDMLLRNMIAGGWMFGREAAIDELDVARDSVPGAGRRWNGDANPTDEIVRLVIRDPDPGQPGWGRLDSVER